ncbi:HET-domain-containing protein [Aspergillus sclerotiicarbonarius CBS 121057]|uniref:HET-domain-containing protein n=1 Tax=Aspergillus sclerotiicarbonarius (strain CBS 121057 / IBT 28362) TaxID=1448318 RepID=A0A319ERB5_ASPSB|nr:HET-domain-containing protein [Aspergillus sclerotiicarbonarius CBS 121057]
MRLICTTRTSRPFQLKETFERKPPPYAILSHRWGDDEITFQDMCNENSNKKHTQGYEKMRRFVERAAHDGYDYAWMDTCCINKESSAELSEAINSMFRWYQLAKKCYAYLVDVPPNNVQEGLYEDLENSQWFKRGWTLQELIAPSDLTFLASDWTDIGSKDMLAPLIHKWTRIDETVLRDSSQLSRFSIAGRMSWASERETTRIEDIAYCLMGIFNVNMPLLYGEGERAFIRLQEEIIKESDDQTIFAWRRSAEFDDWFPEQTGLLAQSPTDFKHSGKMVPFHFLKENTPFSITNRGINLTLPLYSRDSVRQGHCTLVLQVCDLSGHYAKIVGVRLEPNTDGSGQYIRTSTSLDTTLLHELSNDRALETVYVAKSFVTSKRMLRERLLDEPHIFRYTDALNPHSHHDQSLDRPGDDPSKNLILCFDGKVGPELSDQKSNIDKIRHMLDYSGGAQLCYYSKTNKEYKSIMIRSYKWLSENYTFKDNIFVFGFCTGAEIAHEFARMVEYVGVPFYIQDIDTVLENAWLIYQSWNSNLNSDKDKDRSKYWHMIDFREQRCRPADRVKFLGLYDTTENVLWPGQGGRTVAHTIRHAISMDEKQPALRPIRMKDRNKLILSEVGYGSLPIENKDSQSIQDVFFPGGHADIGGVATFRSTETLSLGHIPLAWMVNEAIKSGLHFEDYKLKKEFRLAGQLHKSSLENVELCRSLYLASIQGAIHDTWNLEKKSLSSIVSQKIGKWLSAYSINFQYAYPGLGKLTIPSHHPRRLCVRDSVHLSVVLRMREHRKDYRPQNLQYYGKDWLSLDHPALESLVSLEANGFSFQ